MSGSTEVMTGILKYCLGYQLPVSIWLYCVDTKRPFEMMVVGYEIQLAKHSHVRTTFL